MAYRCKLVVRTTMSATVGLGWIARVVPLGRIVGGWVFPQTVVGRIAGHAVKLISRAASRRFVGLPWGKLLASSSVPTEGGYHVPN